MKKVLSILSLILMFSLTGCMNIEQEATIKSDGSGTFVSIQAFLQSEDSNNLLGDTQKLTTFENIDGLKLVSSEPYSIEKKNGLYLGTKDSYEFDSIDRLDGVRVENSEGSVYIELSSPVKNNEDKDESSDMLELMKDAVYSYTLNLPGKIIETNGQVVKSNTVVWDMTKVRPGDVLFVEFNKAEKIGKPMNNEALELQGLGLLKGTEKGLELERTLTRVEGAVMIKKLSEHMNIYNFSDSSGNPLQSKIDIAYPSPLWDDVPSWAEDDIVTLGILGVIKGASETKFEPNEEMKAIDFMTMVLRMLGYSDIQGEFTWENSLNKAVEVGLITSVEKNKIEAQSFTRESMASITYNTINFNKVRLIPELGVFYSNL